MAAVSAGAAVVAAGASVYSSAQQSSQAKKAAAQQEQNAGVAQQNAEEQARLIQQTGDYNVSEIRRDAANVSEAGRLQVEAIDRQAAFDAATYDRSIADAMRTAAYQADKVRSQAAFEAGSLSRRADHTLSAATDAVATVMAKAAHDEADALLVAADADAQEAASTRRAKAELATTLMDETLARRKRDQMLGGVRAGTAAAGVELSGSALDVLADQAAASELEVLKGRLQGLVQVDAYVEDARSAGVRAVRARATAANVRDLADRDARSILTDATFQAGEYRAQATHISTQAGKDLAEIDAAAATRRDALAAEKAYTGTNLAVLRDTTARETADHVATLQREADFTQWRAEVEARNMSLYGQSQAGDLMARAALSRSQGRSALTSGLLQASATAMNSGLKIYDRWGTTTTGSGTTSAASTTGG
ncbi:hypothetical protein [Azospirillum sp. sgz302134]